MPATDQLDTAAVSVDASTATACLRLQNRDLEVSMPSFCMKLCCAFFVPRKIEKKQFVNFKLLMGFN